MSESEKSLSLVGSAVQQVEELSKQIQLVSGGVLTPDESNILSSMFLAGMFKDVKSLFNAVVKANFGKRVGIDPMTAVTSTYIIDGKLGMEAKAIRNTLVIAGYDINNITPEGKENEYCELEWIFQGKILGKSKFTIEDGVARGYIDPSCVKVPGFPHKHNDREKQVWNKWKKPAPGYETKTSCDCKDNWRAMLEEMLMARATSKGNTKYGNRAFKGEVYEVSELVESPFREDTTPVDVARARVAKAKSIDELQEISKDIDDDTLTAVLADISARSKEILENDTAKANNPSSPTKK